MSGHSKWHTIRHKKGAADAKRGKIFSKLSKAISVAARDGVDPSMNFTLRLAIEKAKQANMPKDNIERAIARGSGAGDGVQLQTVVYEGMAPGGISIIVEAVTDNVNRTFGNIRTIFNKYGGNLDAKVMWQFERKGVVRADSAEVDNRDDFELELIEAGADDISWNEGIEVIGNLSALQEMENVIRGAEISVASAEPEYVATDKVELSDEAGEKLSMFLEMLDEDDDVTNIYTNAT